MSMTNSPDDDYEFLDLDDVTAVAATVPFDQLTVKRIAEVHIDHKTRRLTFFANVSHSLQSVEVPGGGFTLGENTPKLILELLKMITGSRFEPLAEVCRETEIWVRADFAAERARGNWEQDADSGNA